MRLGLAVLSVLTLAGCGDRATLSTFAGTWQGHTRGLTITRSGLAREVVYGGCCHLDFAIRFRLSDPRGTPRAATATATVTAVRIADRSVFTRANPAPRVGELKTVHLREGVITETITRIKYCSPTAKPWVCGA